MTQTIAPPPTRMAWDAVVGQDAATAVLRGAVAGQQVAHAWLLVGPPGVGQTHLGQVLGAALNCPDAVGGEPCGNCSVCLRIARGTYPSVQRFLLEASEHLVDHVREIWIPAATHTSLEGRRRVLHVESADRMNEAAQNAFLKVLEEPPPSVVWLLDVQDESQLLDTIVSRCRRLTFRPWGTTDLAEVARRDSGLEESDVSWMSRAAMGSPQRLEQLADPDMREARRRHLGLLGHLHTHGPGAVVDSAKEIVDWSRARTKVRKEQHKEELEQLGEQYGANERGGSWPAGLKARVQKRHKRIERMEQRRALDFFLDDLSSYLRDLLAVQQGTNERHLINIDQLEALHHDHALLPPAVLLETLAAVDRCRDGLDLNGNAALQVERLIYVLSLGLYRNRT